MWPRTTMILPIMPWCRIDGAYEVGDITIIPYRALLTMSMTRYSMPWRESSVRRDIQGRPVDHAAPCSIRGQFFRG